MNRAYTKEMNQLLEKAYELELFMWNDAMVYHDFINALWRTFLKHDALRIKALQIQENLGEVGALELLASEIDLHRI